VSAASKANPPRGGDAKPRTSSKSMRRLPGYRKESTPVHPI
jgi:hypothetical protein